MSSKKRTLILGAKGMLGHDLAEVFEDWQPVLWDIEEIDITDESQVNEKLASLGPELVINAAAYTNVDGAETSKELATRINGDAVGYLVEVCKKIGAIFVHYSTDYVFSGAKVEGYREEDKPAPINAYGLSKALGERNLVNSGSNTRYWLIRTAWLFGKHGKNFVETMLRLGKEKKELKVVDDQHGSPTYTLDLARKTRAIIEEGKLYGIYHLTNSGTTTWYEFAKKIFELAKMKVKVTPCTSQEYLLPAKRPKYSILINTKLPPMRSWQEALKEYLQSI